MQAAADSIKIWSRLSLSTSLEISQSYQNAESSTDISIYLSHVISTPETESRAWLVDDIDIKAPESVLCADFERLTLHLRFLRVRKKAPTISKRVKSNLPTPNSPESMLLDYISGLEDDARVAFFEKVAAVLPEELSSSIAQCFDDFKFYDAENLIQLLKQRPSSSKDDVLYLQGTHASSTNPVPKARERRKQQKHSKEIVEKLQAWLDAHPGNMSPSGADMVELMKQTGLEKSKLFAFAYSSLLYADSH